MNADTPSLRIGSSWQPSAITWRYSEARTALATALGQLAADLWLRGDAALTSDHVVATMSTDAETAPHQGRDDQAAGDDSGRQEVA